MATYLNRWQPCTWWCYLASCSSFVQEEVLRGPNKTEDGSGLTSPHQGVLGRRPDNFQFSNFPGGGAVPVAGTLFSLNYKIGVKINILINCTYSRICNFCCQTVAPRNVIGVVQTFCEGNEATCAPAGFKRNSTSHPETPWRWDSVRGWMFHPTLREPNVMHLGVPGPGYHSPDQLCDRTGDVPHETDRKVASSRVKCMRALAASLGSAHCTERLLASIFTFQNTGSH